MDAHRDSSFAVGVAGTYDGHGEPFFPIGFHQEFLTGDFIA